VPNYNEPSIVVLRLDLFLFLMVCRDMSVCATLKISGNRNELPAVKPAMTQISCLKNGLVQTAMQIQAMDV